MAATGIATQARTAVAVLRYVYTHPANQQKGRALARAIAFQVRGRGGRRTLVTIGRRMRMWAVLHHTASSKVAYANPPDWAEMQAWAKLLGEGDLFVDVGANVGTYSLWAADLGAEVIAVEPGEKAGELLRENIALNPQARIEHVPCALAAEPGFMAFTEGLDATAHLLPDSSDGRRVQVRTLDEVLAGRTAAGVKIDVEGAERLVLEGASSCLEQGLVKVLQLEWNSLSTKLLGEDREPVATILQHYGYRLFRPDADGVLQPISDLAHGPDVFAMLVTEPAEAKHH
jgi:FkbM family methyltransferase